MSEISIELTIDGDKCISHDGVPPVLACAPWVFSDRQMMRFGL